MVPKQVIFALVTFLHDLFTAVWIGGLITLGVVVMPSTRRVLGKSPETVRLLNVVQRRLSKLVYVSIVGLVLTGLLLSNRAPDFRGLFRFDNPYSVVLTIKHIAVLAMVVTAVTRRVLMGRRPEPSMPTQERVGAGLLVLNIVLGLAVLLLSGFSASFAAVMR